MIKALPTLYSRTSTGAVQTWTVEVDGDKYRTTYGQTDGKKTTTEWYQAYITNEGRTNQRNAEEQALFEAKAVWKKHTDSGYFEDIKRIDDSYYIEPMLAQKYEDRMFDLAWPVYSQPKLDGIRCICSIKGMQSRNGKEIKSAPHIMTRLQNFFEKHPDVILDGELYCDKLNNDFNKICSLVKKTKPTAADLEESAATIQYWVYDVIDDRTFGVRSNWLLNHLPVLSPTPIVYVTTAKVNNTKELDNLFEKYISVGFEGQMVRQDMPYENKRSKHLLKRKEFQDAEYKILSINEGDGNKAGMAGNMTLATGDGRTFNSNIKGDRTYLKKLLCEQDLHPGKMATVKYFNLTPDGIPRFPYVIGIRDYE